MQGYRQFIEQQGKKTAKGRMNQTEDSQYQPEQHQQEVQMCRKPGWNQAVQVAETAETDKTQRGQQRQ